MFFKMGTSHHQAYISWENPMVSGLDFPNQNLSIAQWPPWPKMGQAMKDEQKRCDEEPVTGWAIKNNGDGFYQPPKKIESL